MNKIRGKTNDLDNYWKFQCIFKEPIHFSVLDMLNAVLVSYTVIPQLTPAIHFKFGNLTRGTFRQAEKNK